MKKHRFQWGLLACLVVAISGCASQEGGDYEQEAVAVTAEHDGEVDADEHLASEQRQAAPTPDGQEQETVQEGCQYHDGQVVDSYIVEEAALHVQQCCDGEQRCWSELSFLHGATGLSLFGDEIGEKRFSPDGEFLVVSQRSERAYFVIAVDTLRSRAGDGDDIDEPIDVAELADDAVWSLRSDALHRLEALSARAVDEAGEKCGTGVHLPTLLELAKNAEPYSQRLDVEFEGWRSESMIEMSTHNSDGAATTMRVDIDSGCMERTVSES